MTDFPRIKLDYAYKTSLGRAFNTDSRSLMEMIPDDSVDLVMTSPPFALLRQKDYGNVKHHEYIEWFMPFARQVRRILKPKGSFVLDIGGTWNKGEPTRSVYHYELACELVRNGFYLAQDFFWYNPAKLPSPAEWVTVRRIRVKDSVNTVWWFSKDPNPRASNRKVLVPYSDSMKALLRSGYNPGVRPSGHDISANWFQRDNGGAIPSNLLQIPNTESNTRYQRRCKEAGIKAHPARFPAGLPEFFIRFLTEKSDLVLDPFAGSNVTGMVCQEMDRKWISIDVDPTYVLASAFRFDEKSVKANIAIPKHKPKLRVVERRA
jgi:site-specific DNA-methyltransferase (cytosine-N4-specific)